MRSRLFEPRTHSRRVPFEVVPYVHYEAGAFPDLPGESVEGALTRLAKRFGRVAVVDVSGVKRNEPELEALQAAAKRRALWWDAGSRYATDAMDLFVAGAENVTLRWNTLHSPEELAEAADLCEPGSLHLAIEHPRGAFLAHPRDRRSAGDVARYADELGVGLVHLVDRADLHFLRSLPPTTGPRRVMGPVVGHEAELETLGFAGALVPALQIPPEASP